MTGISVRCSGTAQAFASCSGFRATNLLLSGQQECNETQYNYDEDIHETSFFILPDIGSELVTIENDKDLSDREILEKKDKLIKKGYFLSHHLPNRLLKKRKPLK